MNRGQPRPWRWRRDGAEKRVRGGGRGAAASTLEERAGAGIAQHARPPGLDLGKDARREKAGEALRAEERPNQAVAVFRRDAGRLDRHDVSPLVGASRDELQAAEKKSRV